MRGVPRWLAVVAVLAITTAVCAFTLHRALAPASFVWQLSAATIPADGFTSAELTIRSSNGHDLPGLHVEVETPHRAAVESLSVESGIATAWLRSGVLPGETDIRVTGPGFAPQRSRCGRPPIAATRWATAPRIFCGCTIPLTGWRSAAGLRCWRNHSTTAANRFRRRLTIAPRCCVSLIARLCVSTMLPGRTAWHCRLRLRPVIFSSISIPTRL